MGKGQRVGGKQGEVALDPESRAHVYGGDGLIFLIHIVARSCR